MGHLAIGKYYFLREKLTKVDALGITTAIQSNFRIGFAGILVSQQNQ